MDLKVVQRDHKTNKIFFSLGNKIEFVDGIDELVQLFIINLYNTPGRDLLFPDEGGGILNLLGMNIDINDKISLTSTLKQIVEKTKNEIIQKQSNIDNPQTKLKSVRICSLKNGDAPDEIEIAFQIENEKGQISKFII